MNFIIKGFQEGGPLMFVNLAVLVFAISLIAERLYMLLFRYSMNSKAFLGEVEKAIQAGNLDKAKRLCTSLPKPALPRVIQAALSNIRLGAGSVAAAVDEAMAEVMPMVTKRTSMLWAIANVATLIGLVGTVYGLIQAFAGVAIANPDDKARLLTQGIAHAMNNTAFGLSIALVCIVFHMVISNLAKGLIEGLELGGLRITNLLARLQAEKAMKASAGGEGQG
jgi:biopolymer transport protein ExbB/TolQ